MDVFFLNNFNFKISGGAEGLARRFVFIPFEKEIKNPDIDLLKKIILPLSALPCVDGISL